jgi:UDP-N-acetylmuramoylalanine--D-glutamate ligase
MDLAVYDLIVRSPSVHPQSIVDANPDHPEIMARVTSVTNEFFNVCPAPIIGVTGTKGKGTTSTLIAKLIESAGHKVHLGGNIGTPPLDLLKGGVKPDDWVVLELANFQLIDLKKSPGIAVCLMIAPEHLNWHVDMYEYIQSKQQMFAHQEQNSLAIYNARNAFSEQIATVSHGQKIVYDVPPPDQEPGDTRGVYVEGNHIIAFDEHVCNVDDIALLGRHNVENVCAAIAASWEIVKHNHHVIKKVVKNFAGLPHRLEIVKKVNDVWYINDSFASNPGATIAAIDAITQPKVLIFGGFERGLELDEFVQKCLASQKAIRKIVVIGASRQRVAENLKNAGYTNFVISDDQDIASVVKTAQAEAQKGDAILFSPGFASFDMFKNFEDRGNQFKNYVKSL